jgi:hypothetical protein
MVCRYASIFGGLMSLTIPFRHFWAGLSFGVVPDSWLPYLYISYKAGLVD